MSRPTLFHYTCEHGHRGIGKEGYLHPAAHLFPEKTFPWTGHYVWLTDLPNPAVTPLGLTSIVTVCDRTQYRYRVADGFDHAAPWVRIRRLLPQDQVALLEQPGNLIRYWWVASVPVPVVYDPVPRSTFRNP